MENRIAKKVETHLSEFKNEVKVWFDKTQCDITGKYSKSDFLKFIFDFENISLSKDDFQKRKRVKNCVASNIRCCAKRANGEQCTRRKKPECEYCGTHAKGTPYGKIAYDASDVVLTKKIDIWVEDIKGINYYIDIDGNIYNHGDVLSNKTNPQIIAKYTRGEDNIYHIPEFGI